MALLNQTSTPDIISQAKKELAEERYRAAVKQEKERLRAKAARPWWAKLFPWRITIERRN